MAQSDKTKKTDLRQYAKWLEEFKKMCWLLLAARQDFLTNEWSDNFRDAVPQKHFVHLMMIRDVVPCNENKIMEIVGLTSPGTAIFVKKMVKSGVLIRHKDSNDRRNTIINLSPAARDALDGIEHRLNDYIEKNIPLENSDAFDTISTAARLVNDMLAKK